jgi:hypothetical protein
MLMPDGKPFKFWDDQTKYKRVLHVAMQHPAASDANPGAEERPLKTISAAAQRLRPREKAVIHAGVYRECVRPARGGEGPAAMIAYEAAPGEEVFVRGSEAWPDEAANFRPTDYVQPKQEAPSGATIWTGELPASLFVGYSPFRINNTSGVLMAYGHVWTKEEMSRYLLKRGMLFAAGRPLRQVSHFGDLVKSDGCFWVDSTGERLHFRLPGDADPRKTFLEVTTREQVFAPRIRGLGYIRVSGLTIEHAANAIPLVPIQRGALSATAGHHWIIENCAVRHSNACGADVGVQQRGPPPLPQNGGHVIRDNYFGHHGITGLCGLDSPDETLVENNVFEHIGGLMLERMFECAALKFHVAHRVLIRGNIFRHLTHACGIWLDYLCGWNRVTDNIFADIDSTFGGAQVECSFEPNWIDGNAFWDMRSWRAADNPPESPLRGGHAIFADCCDELTVAHNFFGPSVSYAVACHFTQPDRLSAGRVGLNRRHRIFGNVFAGCAKRILLGRAEENMCDDNLFDAENDRGALCVYRPEPAAVLNLAAWRKYYGFDRRSRQAAIKASFDVEAGRLDWHPGPKVASRLRLPSCRRLGFQEYAGYGPRGPLTRRRGGRRNRIP